MFVLHNTKFPLIWAQFMTVACSHFSIRNEKRFLSFILFTPQWFLGDCTCLSPPQPLEDFRIRNWGRGNNELLPRNSQTLGSAGALPIYPLTLVGFRSEYATQTDGELPPVTDASQTKGRSLLWSSLSSLFGPSAPRSREATLQRAKLRPNPIVSLFLIL